jgi:hypothetical protein
MIANKTPTKTKQTDKKSKKPSKYQTSTKQHGGLNDEATQTA